MNSEQTMNFEQTMLSMDSMDSRANEQTPESNMVWFADSLLSSLATVPGSPEREHVCTLMGNATRIRLDQHVSAAAASTAHDGLASIEANLDRVSLLPSRPLWIETSVLASIGQENVESTIPVIKDVGYLLARDPSRPEHVAIFMAWRKSDSSIHHSYAILNWNLMTMARNKKLRFQAGERSHEEIAGRLMALADAAIPPGFMAEMEIWQNLLPGSQDMASAIDYTTKHILGEHLFLLAAILLLDSNASVFNECPPASITELDRQDQEPVQCWKVSLQPSGFCMPWNPGGFSKPFFRGPLNWRQPKNSLSRTKIQSVTG